MALPGPTSYHAFSLIVWMPSASCTAKEFSIATFLQLDFCLISWMFQGEHCLYQRWHSKIHRFWIGFAVSRRKKSQSYTISRKNAVHVRRHDIWPVFVILWHLEVCPFCALKWDFSQLGRRLSRGPLINGPVLGFISTRARNTSRSLQTSMFWSKQNCFQKPDHFAKRTLLCRVDLQDLMSARTLINSMLFRCEPASQLLDSARFPLLQGLILEQQ